MHIRAGKYNVTVAQQSDLKRITDILNQAIEWGDATAYNEPLNAGERTEWFNAHSDGRYIIYVARDSSEIVGFLTLSPYRKGRQAFANTAEVSYYVDFSHHRKGVATVLMNHAFDHCRKVDFRILLAFLYGHNDRSIQFLKKYGFEQWGLFPQSAIVNGNAYDHVVYGRSL